MVFLSNSSRREADIITVGNKDLRQLIIGKLKDEVFSVDREVNVLALVKGQERYVFIYNEENRSETMRILGRYASNPELSFSWYDAAVLSQKMRRESHRETLAGTREKFTLSERPNNFNRQNQF